MFYNRLGMMMKKEEQDKGTRQDNESPELKPKDDTN